MVEPLSPASAAPGSSRRLGWPRLRIATPLAVLLAVVVWVTTAQVGGARPDERRGAAADVSPSFPAAPRQPTAAPSSADRRVERRPIDVAAAPLSGEVLVRADGLRRIDLASGRMSPALGPTDWMSHVISMPDGSLVCICASVRSAAAETNLELRLATVAEDGNVEDGTRLGQWTGRHDPAVDSNEQADSVWSSSARSPDGSVIFVGVTVRRPPVWQRLVLVVDVAARRVSETIDLPDVASNNGRREGRYAWAPEIQFAPDGRHAVVTAGVVAGDRMMEQPSFVVAVDRSRVGELRPLDALSTGACLDSWPEFGSTVMLVEVCISSTGSERTLRRVTLDGRALSDADLAEEVGGSWPSQLVDASRGRLYLWDPFAWRATEIDAASGEVVASVTIPGDRSASDDALTVIARALGKWVAPPAAAKMLLEPALALSPDGSRLYVVGLTGAEHGGDTEASRVFSLVTSPEFTVVRDWTVEGMVTSIALGPADTILLPTMPFDDASGTRIVDAGLTVLDASNGNVRAVIGRLGGVPLVFPDPAGARF